MEWLLSSCLSVRYSVRILVKGKNVILWDVLQSEDVLLQVDLHTDLVTGLGLGQRNGDRI